MAVAPLASGKPWRNLGLLTIGDDGRRGGTGPNNFKARSLMVLLPESLPFGARGQCYRLKQRAKSFLTGTSTFFCLAWKVCCFFYLVIYMFRYIYDQPRTKGGGGRYICQDESF